MKIESLALALVSQSTRAAAAIAFAPRAASACILIALYLCTIRVGAAKITVWSDAGARQETQQTLAPLTREIARQRARLSSANAEERRDAVSRLGALRRPDAARAAVSALKDSVPIVRATAARTVLSLPAEEAAALLLPLLQDRDAFTRREVAYALGETKSLAAIEALSASLTADKDAGVRGAAAVALGTVGASRAVPVLSATLGRRIPGTSLFGRLLRRKTEENEFVRRAAAVALGQIGDRSGVSALILVLSNERSGDDVRREAARALGLVGDNSPTVINALRAALAARDPYLSRIAFEVLRRLAPSNATQPV